MHGRGIKQGLMNEDFKSLIFIERFKQTDYVNPTPFVKSTLQCFP